MPVSTTLVCPHCGVETKTTKIIPPGARVRCPRCRGVFHILPHEGSLLETIPVLGYPENERSLELLAPENGATTGVTSSEAEGRSDAPPPPRAPAPQPLPTTKP